MRIDPNQPLTNQVVTERAGANAAKTGSVPPGNVWSGGEANFAATAASVGSLTARALETPEVREERVEALRQAINNGTYQMDPGQIADAMLNEAAQ